MPRLLINKKKAKPSARKNKKVVFVIPHSPFQKLIEASRIEHRLSYAQLSKLISDPKKRVHPGSVWIWLHTPNGYPHPKSCTTHHLQRLSAVLSIPLPRIQESLDASRHLYTQRETPLSETASDSWQEFVNWLQNDKRKTFQKATVLNMALRFQAAAAVK